MTSDAKRGFVRFQGEPGRKGDLDCHASGKIEKVQVRFKMPMHGLTSGSFVSPERERVLANDIVANHLTSTNRMILEAEEGMSCDSATRSPRHEFRLGR